MRPNSHGKCLYKPSLAINFGRVRNAVKIWILLSTFLVCSGWILSVFHELNRAGYCVVFGLAFGTFLFWRWKTRCRPSKTPALLFQKFRRRFKRPAPMLFLALALMSFISGALYVSENNDSNEYRVPRVWHWLAEGHWHWIRTLDFRMNAAGCNFEWLGTPLMLFTRHDRFLFLINCVSYLMLPGLIFSVFTRLQVRPRAAWWWMWILPSGFCYALQASSDVNDSFAVIYALASVDFALRAREKNCVSDLWFSILAVALLTGAKQTDIPLALPWLIAVIPCLRLIKTKVLATAGICIAALLVSALPLACLNFHYAGNWMGLPTSSGFWKNESSPPFWNVVGNAFCIPTQNLIPPYMPSAHRWNEAMAHFLQTPLGSHFRAFENFGYIAGRGTTEVNAGIGLWIFILTVISLGAAGFGKARGTPKNGRRCLRWAPYLSLLVFMATVTTFENARQLAAYYVFLFPAMLVSNGQATLVRKRWWQYAGLGAMLLTIAMLIVVRNRPLFPAISILTPLKERYPQSHFVATLVDSYSHRLSMLKGRSAFENTIPAGEQVIGYVTVRGSQEAGQWVPFGHRRVERVLPGDKPAELQASGIHFVMIDSDGMGLSSTTLGDWTNRLNGVVVDSVEIHAATDNTITNYLVRLNPSGTN
jgi:hypothetical protein